MVGVRVLARSVGDALRSDGRGWLICGAVLAITVVRSGVTYSFGMFVVQLHQKFPHLSLAEQSTLMQLLDCGTIKIGLQTKRERIEIVWLEACSGSDWSRVCSSTIAIT